MPYVVDPRLDLEALVGPDDFDAWLASIGPAVDRAVAAPPPAQKPKGTRGAEPAFGRGRRAEGPDAPPGVAAAIRVERMRQGLSLDELGAMVARGRTRMSEIETGKTRLALDVAREIASALGTTVEALAAPPRAPLPVVHARTGVRLDGAAVRAARERAGLSQTAAAQRAGLEQPELSNVEHDRKRLGRVRAERLAGVLGVPLEDLVAAA